MKHRLTVKTIESSFYLQDISFLSESVDLYFCDDEQTVPLPCISAEANGLISRHQTSLEISFQFKVICKGHLKVISFILNRWPTSLTFTDPGLSLCVKTIA